MADKGGTPPKRPSAPDTKRLTTAQIFGRALVDSAIGNGRSMAGADPILAAVFGTHRQKPIQRQDQRTTDITKVAGKSFGPLKMRRVGAPKVSTGDHRLDYEITRVLAQTAGAVNEFQETTIKALRGIDDRITKSNEEMWRLGKKVDRSAQNQKTLADQMGQMFKQFDEFKKQINKNKPTGIDNALALQKKYQPQYRDANGRFLPQGQRPTDNDEDASTGKNSWFDRGKWATAGAAAKSLAKRVGPKVGGAATIGLGLLAIEEGNKARDEIEELNYQKSVKKYGKAKADKLRALQEMGAFGNPITQTKRAAESLKENLKDEPNAPRRGRNRGEMLKKYREQLDEQEKSQTIKAIDKPALAPNETKKMDVVSATGLDINLIAKSSINLTSEQDIIFKSKKVRFDADVVDFSGAKVIGLEGAGSASGSTSGGKALRFRPGIGRGTSRYNELEDTGVAPGGGTFNGAKGATGGWDATGGPAMGAMRSIGSDVSSMGSMRSPGASLSSGASISGSRGATATRGDIPGRPSLKDGDIKETLKAGSPRLFYAGGNANGVDGSLVHVLKEASKDLPPGYRAEMISGHDARSSGTKNHPNGIAMDLKIYDADNKLIPYDRGSAGMKTYEKLHQSVVERGKVLYPDRQWIWGGTWQSSAAGNGDPMHYQRKVPGVGSQSSGAYDDNRGAPKSHDFHNYLMNDKERTEYKQSIADKAKGEYTADGKLKDDYRVDPKTGLSAAAKQVKDEIPKTSRDQDAVNYTKNMNSLSSEGTKNPFGIPINNKKPSVSGSQVGTNGTVLPLGQVPEGKVIDRSKLMEELKDPKVRRHMQILTQAEVGNHPEAQQALMETIFNRAQYRGKSLSEEMTAAYYQPLRNGGQRYNSAAGEIDEKGQVRLDAALEKVAAGSNISQMALHNGSAGIAENAVRNHALVNKIGPEHFTIKGGNPGDPDERNVGQKLAYRDVEKPRPVETTAVPGEETSKSAAAAVDKASLPADWAELKKPDKAEVDKKFDSALAEQKAEGETKTTSAPEVEGKTKTARRNDPDAAVSDPRHDIESQAPTPGNDGYGSQKQNPDGGGICTV